MILTFGCINSNEKIIIAQNEGRDKFFGYVTRLEMYSNKNYIYIAHY